MARIRTDELLEGWKIVAHSARRPATPPRRQISRNGLSAGTLVAVVVAIVVIIAVSSRGSSPAPQPTLPAVGQPSASASHTTSRAPSSASPSAVSSAVASPEPSASAADAADAAASIVNQYTRDLVNGDYAAAWALLAPDGPTRSLTFAAWSSERAQFFVSVGTQYGIVVSPSDVAPLPNWLASSWGPSIDLDHALLVEVDYPALIHNNSGYSLYIVNPTATGLEIYDVR